jgi:hypothetical protein
MAVWADTINAAEAAAASSNEGRGRMDMGVFPAIAPDAPF